MGWISAEVGRGTGWEEEQSITQSLHCYHGLVARRGWDREDVEMMEFVVGEFSLSCCIGGRKRGRRKGGSFDAEVVDEVDGGGGPHEARGDEVACVQCICY